MSNLLIVDDERSLREVLQMVFKKEGYNVSVASSYHEAVAQVKAGVYDLVVSDIKMNDGSGIDLLKDIKATNPETLVVMITAYATTENAIQALKMGAVDYILKDNENFVEEIKIAVAKSLEFYRLRQEHRLLKRHFNQQNAIHNIVGSSPKMKELFQMIETIGATQSTVLITGESGTGKELVAKAIHLNGSRSELPFVSINCGAFPETLLESELFGYMKGAFTGATINKKGLFEVADKGTIFLDEIGEMSLSMQVKLLRILQEKKFRRVGGTEELPLDVRIIAATNNDLQRLMAENKFREDLYYRVSVIPLEIPPLRERKEDISCLANHFLKKFNLQMQRSILRISQEAMHSLEQYDWPGNVRELENTIERGVAFETTEEIRLERLPSKMSCLNPSEIAGTGKIPKNGIDLERHIEEIEKSYIAEALQRAGGVQTRAAELLKMSFRSFRYFVKKYDLR
ncbi:MAG: Fis family transcriptional regulator [Acidobacteria bacterium]|nr:MAG: Fis family transcriptional regulator [Acidobacteriota bacterium]